MCRKNCGCKIIAKVLVLIGALNWGLVGVGMFLGKNWNLVNAILGSMPKLEAIVYVLVGVAALLMIFCKCKKCSTCSCGSGMSEQKMPENM
ncbi:MAG TPA: DUF378 domain-containing protein [Candidatus Paceibacterota bacterium]|nr:DUF378 domain-containing protein [Candidatus Paceibacterota bacterium]